MYACKRGNQKLPAGPGRKRGGGARMDVSKITYTASSVGMPVNSRPRRLREKKGTHLFHLSRRREPDGGNITHESFNARLRQCAPSGGDFAGVCLNWQQYILYSRTFSPCTNQGHAQEAPSGRPRGHINAPQLRRLNGQMLLPITLKHARVLHPSTGVWSNSLPGSLFPFSS